MKEMVKTLLNEFRSGNYAAVVQLWELAPPEVRKLPRAQLLLGHSYYELEVYDKAIVAYDTVLELDPKQQDRLAALYNRGMARRETDDFNGALSDFLAAGSGFEKGHALIGEMYYLLARKRGDYYRMAVKHLAQWLKANPTDGYSRYCLAACHNQLDHRKAALGNMMRCIRDGYVTEEVVEGLVTELGFVAEPDEIERRVQSMITPELDHDGKLMEFARITLEKQWFGGASEEGGTDPEMQKKSEKLDGAKQETEKDAKREEAEKPDEREQRNTLRHKEIGDRD